LKEGYFRVYKEDPDEETWELIAHTKEELVAVIEKLREGSTVQPAAEEEEEEEEEEGL
jgi:hypothetical protein